MGRYNAVAKWEIVVRQTFYDVSCEDPFMDTPGR